MPTGCSAGVRCIGALWTALPYNNLPYINAIVLKFPKNPSLEPIPMEA